jgi:2,3-bisphosphoglycerate-dependent phosphoglycerate mutase
VAAIVLVRHGETDWNLERRYQGHLDPPLNAAGRAQSEQLARELAGEAFDAIYSSDLSRALETAEIVGARLGLPVATDPGLREVDLGSWAGLTRAQVLERFGESPTHDGETRREHTGRVVEAVRRIAARHPTGSILVITHGGSIRAIEAAATGGSLRVMANCETFRLASEQLD